jgi:hypothetical protein
VLVGLRNVYYRPSLFRANPLSKLLCHRFAMSVGD